MSDMYFKSLPDTSTPLIPSNLDKLNDIKVSPTQPETGEKVWFKTDNNSILVKNEDGLYEEFIKKQISFNEIANSTIKHFNIQTDGSSGWYSILKLSDADWSSALIKIDVSNNEGRLQSVLLYAGIITDGDTSFRKILKTIGESIGYSSYSPVFSAVRISDGEGGHYLDINLSSALSFDINIIVIDGIGEWTIDGAVNQSASSNTSLLEIDL